MPKGHAVAVLIISPQGIPLVKDPKKPVPIFWKLPGGRGDAKETAEECAIREIEEEIGVLLSKNDLEVIYQEDKNTHILTIFQVNLPKLPQIKQQGNEGEKIGVFSAKDILAMQDFFPNHRKIVSKILETIL